jgi:hypothetical protein
VIRLPTDCRLVFDRLEPREERKRPEDALPILDKAIAEYDRGVPGALYRADDPDDGPVGMVCFNAGGSRSDGFDVNMRDLPEGTTMREAAGLASHCMRAMILGDECADTEEDPLEIALAAAEIARTIPGMLLGCASAPTPWRPLKAFSRDGTGRSTPCLAVDAIAQEIAATGGMPTALAIRYRCNVRVPLLSIGASTITVPPVTGEEGMDPIRLMRAMAALDRMRNRRR